MNEFTRALDDPINDRYKVKSSLNKVKVVFIRCEIWSGAV